MAKGASRKGWKWKILGLLALAALITVGVFISRIEPPVKPESIVLTAPAPTPPLAQPGQAPMLMPLPSNAPPQQQP